MDAGKVNVGDIIQLDPTAELGKEWGPQLCVVSELKPWGVQCYFVHAASRGDFGPAYLRIPTGSFVVVGRAEWMVGREP